MTKLSLAHWAALGSLLLGFSSLKAWAASADVEAVSRENRLRSESYAGNLVDTATGAFVRVITLLSIDGGRDLNFGLRYNSRLTENLGAVGYGWSHEYEAFVDGDPGGVMTVHWDVNRKNSFQFVAADQPYAPLDEAARYAKFEAVNFGGHAWRVTRMDGTHYEFTGDGKLARVGNKVRQYLNLVYRNGRLDSVEEPIGNYRVDLAYNGEGLLSTLTDDLDREVRLTYDDQNRLIKVAGPLVFANSDVNSSFDDFFVPDNDPDGAFSEIVVDEPGTVGLVKLTTASWIHSKPEDLEVWLVSPSGTRVLVHDDSRSTNANGRILTEFDGEPRTGNWRVEAVDTASGNGGGQIFSWRMRFTEATNAIHYTYAEGSFPAAGRLTAATDLLGEPRYANTYDSDGRVLTQDDGLSTNAIATFSYQTVNSERITTYRDRLGETWTYRHDSDCRLLAVTNSLNHTTGFAYNSDGDRTSVTDALGRITRFTYDSEGNILTMTGPANNTTSFTYEDAKRNVKTITDALGRTTTFKYDGNSRNNIERVTDALGIEDTKTYNGDGQLQSNLMSDGAGITYSRTRGKVGSANHPGGNGDVSMGYDAVGRLIRTTNADGKQSTTAYSATGNITKQTDEHGLELASGYDHRDRLIKKIDRTGQETVFAYDGNDNLISRTNTLGETTAYRYDGENRLIQASDAAGRITRIEYDAVGRITRQIDGEGNGNVLEYDAVGNVTAVRDSQNTVILRMTYDPRDLVVAIEDAYGQRTTASYDAAGRKTEIVDEQGRRTEFVYDALDRLTEVRDPFSRTMKQAFAGDDVVISVTDGENHTTSFAYDGANRIRQVATAESRQTQSVHNGRDLIKSFTTPSGKRFAYAYDDAGRLESVTPQGPISSARARIYFYDGNGNHIRTNTKLPSQSRSIVRLKRTYDASDRLTSFENGDRELISYEYDRSGNLAKITYPGGDAVTYDYDGANRLTSVTDWAGRQTEYRYDSNNRLTDIQYTNGTSRQMTYDFGGQILLRTDLDSNGQVIARYEFAYDSTGKILVEDYGQGDVPYQGTALTMTHDRDNRLNSVNGQAVMHDDDGNLISHPLMQSPFEYDEYGNLVHAGDYDYVYDEEDHLIEWHPADAGQAKTRFTINPRGRTAQILQKRDPDGTLTRYVYGIGLIYEETDGATRTFHYDHRGSTVALSNDSGTVTGNLVYGPFGELVERTGNTDTLFLFNGLFGVVSDPQGLNYMRFRWYWPAIKRFVSEDAHFGHISAAGTLNRYAYAGNDPISQIDPEGEFWWVAAGAASGAAVATLTTLVVDIVDDGEINTPWEDYASAAIGGAVSGGILAACPTCAGTAGGAGAAAEYLANKGFTGEKVDFTELAIATATGAAIGKFAQVGGKKLASGSKTTPVKRQGITSLQALAKRSAKEKAKSVLIRVGVAAGIAAAKRVAPHVQEYFQQGADAVRKGRLSIFTIGQGDINARSRGVYGEFIHWGLYYQSLGLTDRPLPNNPNNVMASF